MLYQTRDSDDFHALSHHRLCHAKEKQPMDVPGSVNPADSQGQATLTEEKDDLFRDIRRTSSAPVLFHEQKWRRLRKHYSDQYLDLFKKTFEGDTQESSTDDLDLTQLGAVIWEPAEKTRLFDAVDRKGRHDLRAISDAVESKSEIEVKAYLDNLREQFADRQLFKAQTKNVSHAEIPASFEIGRECEAVLNQAAEALAAFQEQYDFAVGQRMNPVWLIDPTTAAQLDQSTHEREIESNSSDEEGAEKDAPLSAQATRFFHLSAFITLSEWFFMNQASEHSDNWRQLAEDGQRPAMTMDVVSDFYNLITSFTRRLIQTCIFLAMSRIRSSASTYYRHGGIVRHEDVSAALAVLGVKSSSADFWVGLARRNALSVVDGGHKKGASTTNVMSYEEVEEILSTPRRRRSVSATSEENTYSQASSADSGASHESDSDEDDSSGDDEDGKEDEEQSSEIAPSDEDEDDETDGDPSGESEHHPATKQVPIIPMSQQEKIELLEQDQDEYMDRLDQQTRKQEEARLLHMLGLPGENELEEEDEDDDDDTMELGRRPKVLRKSVEECMGWSGVYQAEWEGGNGVVPAEAFTEVGSRVKRRKLAHDSHE